MAYSLVLSIFSKGYIKYLIVILKIFKGLDWKYSEKNPNKVKWHNYILLW